MAEFGFNEVFPLQLLPHLRSDMVVWQGNEGKIPVPNIVYVSVSFPRKAFGWKQA